MRLFLCNPWGRPLSIHVSQGSRPFGPSVFGMLQELLKHSANSDHASELQGALNAMLDLLKSVNDSMHQIAITGYEVKSGIVSGDR